MTMFVEEILNNYKKEGIIKSSFSKEEIKDIIFTSMHHINRFNGITKMPYNVYLHSYHVGNLSADLYKIIEKENYDEFNEETVSIIGYMHDMSECIIGDIVYPIKNNIMKDEYIKLEEIEKKFILFLGKEIFNIPDFENKFNFSYPFVKKADKYIGIIELIGVSKEAKFKSEQFNDLFKKDEVNKTIINDKINEYVKKCKENIKND